MKQGRIRMDGVKAVDGKVYEYESLIYEAGETGGAAGGGGTDLMEHADVLEGA